MEVYLDEQQMDALSVKGNNLEEILSDIMASHLSDERIVSEVRINGETYSEPSPHAALTVSRTGIQRLDLLTVPLEQLAQILLDTGPGHLDILAEAAVRVAGEFRIGDEAEANDHFSVFLQALQDFFAFLGQVLTVMTIPLAHLETEGLSAPVKLRELSQALTEINRRQEDEDWILLADCMEYELAPLLRDWQKILRQVRRVAH